MVKKFLAFFKIEKMEEACGHYIKSVAKYDKGQSFFCQEVTRYDYMGHMHFFRGTAYERTNDLEKAKECFREATKVNPGWADPFVAGARLLRVQGENPKEAVDLYGKAAMINPSGTNLAEMAEMLYLVGEKEKATTFMTWAGMRFGLEKRHSRQELAEEWIKKYGVEIPDEKVEWAMERRD